MRNDDLYERSGGGAANAPQGGSGGYGAGAGGMGAEGAGGTEPLHTESAIDRGKEQAREGFEHTRETVREKTHEAGEKARDLRMNLADKLETGAQRLRQRAAGVSGAGDGPLNKALDTEAAHKMESGLADGMQSTADWVRNADLESIRTGVETQVRNHPGRTLLVALGIGYLIGRAFGGGEKSAGAQSASSAEGQRGFGSSTSHGLH